MMPLQALKNAPPLRGSAFDPQSDLYLSGVYAGARDVWKMAISRTGTVGTGEMPQVPPLPDRQRALRVRET